MEHQQKSIAKKRERHYPEFRLIIGIGLFIFGALTLFILTILWSQYLFPLLFNSRLLFYLTVNKDSYATCDNSFASFTHNADTTETSVFSFYVFNITNPGSIIQRGERPNVIEMGPYSFSMSRNKYDLSFDLQQPASISFKEYSNLTHIPPSSDACRRLYMEDSVVCDADNCICKDLDETVTVVNPLFAKTLWQDGGSTMISYLSQEVYGNIKRTLEIE
jgi:hypothetical protein